MPPQGGGAVLHQFVSSWVLHAKTFWIQSVLRFCKNEGSKIFIINEKGGGSIGLKIKDKIDTNCLKSVKYYILVTD